MKKFIAVFIIMFVLSGCNQLIGLSYYNNTYVEKVVEVVDAQIIVTENKDKKKNIVMMYGIVVPRIYTEEGKKARKYLSDMVLDKKVRFTVKSIDKDGRMLSLVYPEKESKTINGILIKDGYAKKYDEGCKLPVCNKWK